MALAQAFPELGLQKTQGCSLGCLESQGQNTARLSPSPQWASVFVVLGLTSLGVTEGHR